MQRVESNRASRSGQEWSSAEVQHPGRAAPQLASSGTAVFQNLATAESESHDQYEQSDQPVRSAFHFPVARFWKTAVRPYRPQALARTAGGEEEREPGTWYTVIVNFITCDFCRPAGALFNYDAFDASMCYN